MIIDTEWGGFGDGEADYIKTQYDEIVDANSVHPGVQSYVFPLLPLLLPLYTVFQTVQFPVVL